MHDLLRIHTPVRTCSYSTPTEKEIVIVSKQYQKATMIKQGRCCQSRRSNPVTEGGSRRSHDAEISSSTALVAGKEEQPSNQ